MIKKFIRYDQYMSKDIGNGIPQTKNHVLIFSEICHKNKNIIILFFTLNVEKK